MNGFALILLATAIFTLIILILVALILLAKSKLMPSGSVKIVINDQEDQKLEVSVGGKLLPTLAAHQIFLSSACGGKGSCAQ